MGTEGMSRHRETEKLLERIQKLQEELDSIRAEVDRLSTADVPVPDADTGPAAEAVIPAQPRPSVFRRFFTELTLGGTILGRLGLLTIIIAGTWFIKYAFDNRWINESGRIILGLLAGFFTITWSLRLAKKRLRLIPAPLAGTGFSLLYIAVYGAYYLYDIIGRPESFSMMVAIAVLLAVLAAHASSEALYLFSIIGAFAAPVLISSGENAYRFLFAYVAVINALFLYISTLRPWRISAWIILFADAAVFSLWAADKLVESSFTVPFLFVVFILMVFMVRQVVLLPERGGGLIIVICAALFLAQGAWVMNQFHPLLRPHLFLGTAAVSLAFILINRRSGASHG